MKILYIKQTDLKDCGVSCLLSIVRFYGGYVTREYLRDITKTTSSGVSVYSLVEAGEKLGFETKALKGQITKFKETDFPMIAHVLLNKRIGHFVVIEKVNLKSITIMDPNSGFRKLSFEDWKNITTNVYILYKPKMKILKQDKETGFWQFLVPILKRYKYSFLLVLFFSIIYTICNILLSYQFQFFLDLVSDEIIETVHLIFYFLIGVIILKEITNLFRNVLINYLNHRLDKTLICEIYEHIIKLPYLYFKNRMKGDMITRIQDVFVIREVISKFFVTITIDLFMALFVFFTALYINVKLAYLVLGITIFYILIMLCYNQVITKRMQQMKEKEALVNNHLIESLSSISTIKGMQIEDWLQSRLILKYDDYQDTSFRLYKSCYQENFFKEITYGIGLLIVIYVGVLEVLKGNFSLSKLLVFNSLLGYYFTPIQNLCTIQVLIKESIISFTRIKELLNVPCEKLNIDYKHIKRSLKGNITIRNLEYSYNGINQVLKCDKLDIKNSEHVLFYGISGGGKSTLMKILCRYIDNFQGSIKIDGKNLSQYNLKELREKIVYVSQDEMLYTDTIYNNIVLDHEISYQKYLEIIKLTGVDKLIEKSMLKDDMLLDNNASNFSGGEKQRIILARTLVKNSDIYIFDESFSALDIKSERILLKKIFEYLKNKTILVISHRFNNRDLYQKFILIEKGILYEY